MQIVAIEELLSLIPQVRKVKATEDVNKLLHTWFVSLGEINYGTGKPSPIWTMANEKDKVPITDNCLLTTNDKKC